MLSRFGVAALLATSLSSCTTLSYHNNSYFPVNETPRKIEREPEVKMVERLGDGPDRLYAQRMELVGFSHFTSPLAPQYAEADARRTAVARGAEQVLMTKPIPQKLNQHYYLTTFWRSTSDFILGAYYQDLPPDVMGTVGCDSNAVVVMVVARDTPAAELGLQPGDHIVYFDGEPVHSAAFLDRKLVQKAAQEIEIRVVRESGNFAGKVKLLPRTPPPSAGALARWPILGVDVVNADATAAEREKLGLGATKVYVSGIRYQTPACLANLSTGDIILEVDGKKINQGTDVVDALAGLKSDQIPLKILRGTAQIDTIADASALSREAYMAVQRLDIPEAHYVMPWRGHEPASWTTTAIIAATAANLGPAYASYQQQQYQAQLAAYQYYQRQAALAPRQQSQIISGSRGRTYVRSTTGELVSVDRAAVAKIAATPGGKVEVGRRGSGAQLVDATGKRTSLDPQNQPFTTQQQVLKWQFDNRYWEDQAAMYELMRYGMKNPTYMARTFFPMPDLEAHYRPFPKLRSPF